MARKHEDKNDKDFIKKAKARLKKDVRNIRKNV